jgi:hypothetical protein
VVRFSGGSAKLSAQERVGIAYASLSGSSSISSVASVHGVSRKTVYRYEATAREAIETALTPVAEDDEPVLFHLPVTRRWLRQLIVALTLICRGSFRGVLELIDDLLGVKLSLGHVHNVLAVAGVSADAINRAQDLSPIAVGLHDEMFHDTTPILAGVDAASTYTYLLAAAEHRDGDTWGVHLLDLRKQGLAPRYTIADAGKGARAGQRLAWEGEETPACHGDVFHMHHQMEITVNLQKRISDGRLTHQAKLQARIDSGDQAEELVAQLSAAIETASTSKTFIGDLRLLIHWMERDVLSLAGPCLSIRQELFDFITAELEQRAMHDEQRIRPLCVALKNQRDYLLAFAGVVDGKLADIARRYHLSVDHVQQVCLLHRLPITGPSFWPRWDQLHTKLGTLFLPVFTAVAAALAQTPRCSSLVENLNSRLRTYVTLRREIGGVYLGLLQFYFNHRRFTRSRRPERVGKSPCELMTGKPHPHWLTMLGLGSLQPKRA